jgi:hypothetical protein
MNQKVMQQRFLNLWLLQTPKKLILGHLLIPGSGSGTGSGTGYDQKGPDLQHWPKLKRAKRTQFKCFTFKNGNYFVYRSVLHTSYIM